MNDSHPVTQILDLLQSIWLNIIVPFVSTLWDLAWQDPKMFIAVLIIIWVIIWAAQESAKLGR